ncbi:MAG: hypothetical protein DMG70_19220 [Acidobacteria bacterium]|nr:MAG: hypothetical protein DMG70_19220 [Acidobacteriota bacterium]PYY09314.1 MAG: hypothetical protein DMG69_10985 [Acidobacteriota bacterium]
MQSLLHRRYMSPDFVAASNGSAIGSNQILGQLGREVVALFDVAGIQLVVEADQESLPFGNCVEHGRGRSASILGRQGQAR